MDPAGQLAQLLDCQAQLLRRATHRLHQGSIGVGAERLELPPGGVQRQRQGQQALLRAVVQVPLDPQALLVAGLHDPGPRGANLVELGADLGVEALVLDRHARRGAGRLDQSRIQRRVVDQRRQRLAVALHDGGHPGAAPGARSRRGQRDRVSIGIHPAALAVEGVDDLQSRIGEGLRQRRLEPAGRQRAVQRDHQVADRAAGQPGLQQPPHE